MPDEPNPDAPNADPSIADPPDPDASTVDSIPARDVTRAVIDVLAASAPDIRAGLPGRRVQTDAENESGERQLAADVWADNLLCERLGRVDGIATYASEERETAVDVADDDSARFLVAVDPLDGSSNLKSNNPMGTVFGIYASPSLPVSGRDLVAAGFILYGPITTLVLAEDDTAREFVVDDGRLLDGGRVELPEDPVVYGFGGRAPDWTPDFAVYVDEVANELKLRYGGAMIADVSQVLTYGGIFGYPHLQSAPNGKLRLLFEGAPVAYVVEAAGGASSDGASSLLDIDCTEIHQRTPVFVGSTAYVDRLEDTLASQ